MNTMGTLFAHFPYAIAGGILTAIVCSMLGTFVILKRMVFIGITLSETATCGVALAFMLKWPPFAGAALLTFGVIALLNAPLERLRLTRDAVMGMVFVTAAAAGVLIVAQSGFGLMEVKALLYGDLILANAHDLRVLFFSLVPVGILFLLFLRPMLYTFLDRECMQVFGGRPVRWETLYFCGLGIVISAASKIAGPLLVFCYLLVPPVTALMLSKQFSRVVALSVLLAVLATAAGFVLSFHYDLPTNQTICAVSVGLLPVAAVAKGLTRAAQAAVRASTLGRRVGEPKQTPARSP